MNERIRTLNQKKALSTKVAETRGDASPVSYQNTKRLNQQQETSLFAITTESGLEIGNNLTERRIVTNPKAMNTNKSSFLKFSMDREIKKSAIIEYKQVTRSRLQNSLEVDPSTNSVENLSKTSNMANHSKKSMKEKKLLKEKPLLKVFNFFGRKVDRDTSAKSSSQISQKSQVLSNLFAGKFLK